MSYSTWRSPQQFHIRANFEKGSGLIFSWQAGTTMTRGHDVDTLDQANNMWLHDYLPDPLHAHVVAT